MKDAPTIAAVRGALPPEHRDTFTAQVDTTPGPLLARVLREWQLSAAVLADPEFQATARRIAEERAGLRPRPRALTHEEMHELWGANRDAYPCCPGPAPDDLAITATIHGAPTGPETRHAIDAVEAALAPVYPGCRIETTTDRVDASASG